MDGSKDVIIEKEDAGNLAKNMRGRRKDVGEKKFVASLM